MNFCKDVYKFRRKTLGVIHCVDDALSEYTFVFAKYRKTFINSIPTTTTTNYSYDDDDRILTSETNSVITTFSHNNRGDLVTKTVPTEGTTEYTFNAAGELRRITYPDGSKSTYDYDPFSIRKRKTEKNNNGDITDDTRYFYAGFNELPKILSKEKLFGQGQRFTHYSYAFEILLRDIDDEIAYFLTDNNLNVIGLADESGIVTDRYKYSSYGELLSHMGEDENNLLFASEPYETKNGLIYFRKRYYSRKSCRFITKDPASRLAHNLYAFCGNNPIHRIDSSGMQYFVYDGKNLVFYAGNMWEMIDVRAYSGLIGKQNSKEQWRINTGPIPEGIYDIVAIDYYPVGTENRTKFGPRALVLKPDNTIKFAASFNSEVKKYKEMGKKTTKEWIDKFGRESYTGSFLIHSGSSYKGTHGCIKNLENIDEIMLWARVFLEWGNVQLIVDYSGTFRKRLMFRHRLINDLNTKANEFIDYHFLPFEYIMNKGS